jgi:hypothetical protein
MEKNFVRVRSVKDIAVFVSLIVLGGIFVALPVGTGINIAGGSLVVLGLVLALILKSGYKDAVTGEGYFKKEHFFQQEMKKTLLSVIPTMPEVIELSEEDKGNAVRLDVYYSQQTGKAYLQLFEFVPYEYRPCSDMLEYELYEVKKLIR